MALTNALLSAGTYELTPGGACGASTTITVPLAGPVSDNAHPQGRFTVGITNVATTVPLHLEVRGVYSTNQSSFKMPLAVALISNPQSYGGSAVATQTLVLVQSGASIMLPYEGVAGTAVELAIMAASDATALVSGLYTIWRM